VTKPVEKYRDILNVEVDNLIPDSKAIELIIFIKNCSDFSCITRKEDQWIHSWTNVYEYEKPYSISLNSDLNHPNSNLPIYKVELEVKDRYSHLSYYVAKVNGTFKVIGISHGEVG